MAGQPGRSCSGTCPGAFGRAARLPRKPVWVAPSEIGLLRSRRLVAVAIITRGSAVAARR
jgi:hypothetical protein